MTASNMESYWESVDSLTAAGARLAQAQRALRESAQAQESRSADSLSATRTGIERVNAGSLQLLNEARSTLGRLGLQGQLGDSSRRTGGPPLTQLSELDPFVRALKRARAELETAVSDEERRRATPDPVPAPEPAPEPPPASTNWLPWVALGIIAAVVIVVIVMVL